MKRVIVTASVGLALAIALISQPARASDPGTCDQGQLDGSPDPEPSALECGMFAGAFGFDTIAIGSSANAGGNGNIAIGADAGAYLLINGNYLPTQNAIAIGYNSLASASNSIALGSNSVTTESFTVSVGALGAERRIVNVANGVLSATSTDAVNGSQLFALQQQLDGLGGDDVAYDDASQASVTLGGASGTTIGNLADGEVTATSTEAINGSQLFATNQEVANNTAQIGVLNSNVSSLQTIVDQHSDTLTMQSVTLDEHTNQISSLNIALSGIESELGAIGASIDDLNQTNIRQDREISRANAGVAMALAMESPAVPAGSTFAISGGVGGFAGEHAIATAISTAVGPRATLSAGVGYTLKRGKVGYRAGFQIAF